MRSNDVVYSGRRTKTGCQISRQDPNGDVTRISIVDSLKLRRHSPAGFNWGYGGSGPAQTALALLLDFTEDPDIANRFHQDFKFMIVGGFKNDRWSLSGHEIVVAIARIREERESKKA